MTDNQKIILRRLSKLTCASTVVLIFVGGLVTSTGSGLSVPDWPLSYGMVFPPMVGGVFYEHGHRMVATVIGFMMLCLTIITAKFETRKWVRCTAFVALAAVILQGILGGITVKFFLPTWVSVSHGVLAQTFLLLTVFLAYIYSKERESRENENVPYDPKLIRIIILLIACVYLQLIVGALMRHTHSGLAIPDFPTMGGKWWPKLDQEMLNVINAARFDMNLEPVTQLQVLIHLLHRTGAVILLSLVGLLDFVAIKISKNVPRIRKAVHALNWFFIVQIALGIFTVLSHKEYHITSFHVVTGAITLAWSFFLLLRAVPITFDDFKKVLSSPR